MCGADLSDLPDLKEGDNPRDEGKKEMKKKADNNKDSKKAREAGDREKLDS